MKELLEKCREINRIVQKASGHPVGFADIADVLCRNIETNVYIFGRRGRVWGYAFIDGFRCVIMENIIKVDGHYPERYNDELLKITRTAANISRDGMCIFSADTHCHIDNKRTTVVPIIGGGQRLGTIMLSKPGSFTDDDLILAEFGATLIGMEILRARVDRVEKAARQKAAVANALDTLSFSEFEAADHIFNELGGKDGLLIASKIADKVGITRSVIVNSLRKLESAGLLEVRSLGMKGTYIHIINEYLIEEMENMRSRKHIF